MEIVLKWAIGIFIVGFFFLAMGATDSFYGPMFDPGMVGDYSEPKGIDRWIDNCARFCGVMICVCIGCLVYLGNGKNGTLE